MHGLVNYQEKNQEHMKQPIAITGIGCRFPGGGVDTESFWQILCQGKDAVTEIPANRWPISLFFDPERGRTEKTYSKWGAFLPEIDQFDAGFFGISSAEADVMDPQQRLMLETAWEAMEDGGHVPNLHGERTGVFIGVSTRDYEQIIQNSYSELGEVSPFMATGLASSIIANRLSYCFNFTGPSFIVDTACSSSLLAVHLACQSLWERECEVAIAGGVNCLIGPSNYLVFSSMGLLSPDGRCRSFDSRANGFVRGEGAGALLLQPLDAALARGSRIYSVILGTGTNQDGHTKGMAFPNRSSQVALLREVSRQAGVSPHDIAYVEAHGTGTAAGDPVEASALGEVFGAGRDPGRELLIGSVKSNIGHLESGAGIAGIIKCALCLKYGSAPPSLHFEKPNSAIDFDRWRLKVPTRMEPFPRPSDMSDATWHAGVNSFGFGGSNAFVLLRSQPQPDPKPVATSPSSPHGSPPTYLLPISARDPDALRSAAKSFAEFLDKAPYGDQQHNLSDIVHAAARQRTHHNYRMTATGRSISEFREQLLAFASGEQPAGIASGKTSERQGPVFVFSGQGAQWHAMGRQLYEQEPVFRQMLERCHEALLQCGGWSFMAEFLSDENRSRMMEPAIAQPAIFALQVALVEQWAHWGVRPAIVVGHSVGEIAAAYCAGVYTLDEAMRVIYHRGDTMSKATGNCGMLAAALNADQACQTVAPFHGDVCIGAINSPSSVTLSGDLEALSRIAQQLTEQGVWNRFVPVNYAFHSRQMDPVQTPLLDALRGLAPRNSQIPMYSTVTGQLIEGTELDASYWWRNVREKVCFGPVIEAIARKGYTTFMEVAAHPVLSTSIKQSLQRVFAEDEAVVLPSLRKQEEDIAVMLQSIGKLHCLGYEVAWGNLVPEPSGHFVSLPHYPWNHRRHWNESAEWTRTKNSKLRHPLLMRRLNLSVPTWYCLVNSRLLPYVSDHAIQGRPLFPAAGYIEMALAVAAEMFPDQPSGLLDIELERALFLPEVRKGVDVHIQMDTADRQFSILSSTGADIWTRNARGIIQLRKSLDAPAIEDLEEIRLRCHEELSASQFYAKTQKSSLHYGPMFRGVRRVWRQDGEVLAQIEQNESLAKDTTKYHLHPALLDACLQPAFVVMREDDPQAPVGMLLPHTVDRLQMLAPLPNRFWAHVRLVRQGTSALVVDIQAIADDGRVLVVIEGLKYRPVEGLFDEYVINWFYSHEWILKPLPDTSQQEEAPSPLAACLPPWKDLLQTLHSRAKSLRKRMLLPHLQQDSRPDLDQIWGSYIIEALQCIGWFPSSGEEFSTAALMEHLGIPAECQGLLQRCLATLAEQKLLLADNDGRTWQVPAALDLPQATILRWRTIVERYPSLLCELMLLKHCGEILPRAIVGEYDGHVILNNDEISHLLDQAFTSAPTWVPSHLIIRQAVAEVVARLPEGRRLRILELGAGGSGLSSHIVAELSPSSADYVFTDPSGHLSSWTEDRIRQYGFGDCRVLDLSTDPELQGFKSGQFDLIIGQDPFPPSSDRLPQIQNATKLLTPGGLLIFSEWDALSRMGEIQNILLHSSSRMDDGAGLKPQPPTTRHGWLCLLRETGLQQPSVIADIDDQKEIGRSTYLAQRTTSANEICKPVAKDVPAPPCCCSWLILSDSKGVGQRLADALLARGYTVRLERAEEGLENFDGLLEPATQGIVHLSSLDMLGGDDLSMEALRTSQRLSCHSVLRLVQAIGRRSGTTVNPRLWLITRGAQPVGNGALPLSMAQTPLIGLGRVIANEYPDLRCRMVDLSLVSNVDDNIRGLLGELMNDDRDDQVALRGEARYVQRVDRMSILDSPEPGDRGLSREFPCQLRIGRPGMLDHLRLRPIERRAPEPDEIEVEVCAAALNFRDVMKAMGIYPGDAPDANFLGDEFSGIITRIGDTVSDRRVGDQVFGVCLGAMATHVTVHASVCLPLPPETSFEEATTIPVAYLTAYHALHQLGQAKAGERILIHSAAGGVGLAAVRLALSAGLEVFGTASSPMKRQLLRSLGVRHVSNSRTLDFADDVMALTNGEGIDIVLNSLTGEAIPRSLETLRINGRFLEIGKRDIYAGTALNLKPFRNSLSYFAIDMARTLEPPHVGTLLNKLLAMLRNGTVRPLPYHPFPLGEASRAFRHMAQGKHIGKIVLTVDQTPLSRKMASNASRGQFRDDVTYLITGGLRGLGLSLAEHLASRGARHLALTSHSGPVSEESQAGLAKLQCMGVNVLARKSDISSESELATLLAEIDCTMPPLGGVIHAATVYADGLVQDMTPATFEPPMEPKAYGAWNLHRQTLKRKLDMFVMISSISAVIGNVGQANYAAANSFLDALAHHRHRSGLPALSIQLDRIRDVGHVARSKELTDYFFRLQWWGISSEHALEGLDRLLTNKATVALVSSLKWIKSVSGLGPLLKSPRFELLVRDDNSDSAEGRSISVRHRLDAASPEEKHKIVTEFLLSEIANVLRIPVRKLPMNRPLKEIGMDSLMAMELMIRVESKLGMSLPPQNFSVNLTVSALADATLPLLGIETSVQGDGSTQGVSQ